MFKIIIVDDGLPVKRSIKNIIERGYSDFVVVGEAEDGEEALALVEETMPDIIITDIRMPRMNGLKLAEEIRNRNLAMEIVVISGYSDFEYAKQALHFGVTNYLLKPIVPDEMTSTLERIAEKLMKERQSLAERSDHVMNCRQRIKEILKYLWVLNEDEVELEVQELVQYLSDHQFESANLKEMYINFLSLLNAEISEKSGMQINIQSYPEYELEIQSNQIYSKVQALLAKVMEDIRRTRNWGNHRNIKTAIQFIKEDYTKESFSLKEAADFVGMSPTYFSKSFKEEIGMSYTQYIAKLRMEKAVDLLNDPVNKVYEVAYAVGYGEYPHFAKVFKKYYGFSPTDYRHKLDAV